MTTNNDLDPSEPSHDDVSNKDDAPDQAIPEFGDEAHDENGDAPAPTPPGSGDRRAPEERITG
ncbi:MAG TPA: hypothetical protein VM032_12485 [Vicinamibacterales bacterium]|nr:hypothetical protein [Vicinamibacterales bacterium]